MRLLFVKLSVTFLFLFVCNSISSGQDSNPWSQKDYGKAEKNYIMGLESDITGIRANSAYYLGEMKSQTSVHYLTYMIKYDKCFACRIVAALSLLKIGDPSGVQEVKKLREFIPSDTSSDKNYILYLSILWKQYLQTHPEDAFALKNILFPGEV